jgi:phytoene dehydrogenase-like protein
MPTPSADAYDVVIIGAGISGLVCGCYLAKAGMKVLIAEQHHKPGGYCTSFKRQGFTFDAAAHSFGGYQNGPLGMIFRQLGMDRKMEIRRFDPSDTIRSHEYEVSFWSDLERTVNEFQTLFPDEKSNIERFFRLLLNPDPNSFSRIRSWTFANLLDNHFADHRLKAVLSFPLFGNGGLPPSQMSAFIASKIFKEYLLDGGYYPEGGMQVLPDKLAEVFRENGGEIILSSRIKEIKAQHGRVSGVTLEKSDFIPARYVISNCDFRQTFLELLTATPLRQEFRDSIDRMVPSLSIFVLYLGIDRSFTSLPAGTNVWILPHYDLESAYLAAKEAAIARMNTYMIRLSPDRRTMLAFLNIGFKASAFWHENKKRFMETFVQKIERDIDHGLSGRILYREAATPSTLHRYTSNYEGAAYGWACTPAQLGDPGFRKPSFVEGLYLTGHWTTEGLGIPGVVYLGFDTAKKIARKERLINT